MPAFGETIFALPQGFKNLPRCLRTITHRKQQEGDHKAIQCNRDSHCLVSFPRPGIPRPCPGEPHWAVLVQPKEYRFRESVYVSGITATGLNGLFLDPGSKSVGPRITTVVLTE